MTGQLGRTPYDKETRRQQAKRDFYSFLLGMSGLVLGAMVGVILSKDLGFGEIATYLASFSLGCGASFGAVFMYTLVPQGSSKSRTEK